MDIDVPSCTLLILCSDWMELLKVVFVFFQMRVLKSDFAKYNITDDDEIADDLGN